MTAPDDSPLTADDLMASPRGRSLVFGLVNCAPAEIDEDTIETESDSVTAVDIAEALRRTPPQMPTQAELEHAMAEVIGEAMYWQPPDGEDLIAAAPEVRATLHPFAEALIDSGLLDSWSDPLDVDSQWALAWDDSTQRGVLAAVFDMPLGSGAEQSAITIDDLTAVDDEPGVILPRGLEEWLAHMLTCETSCRHDFAKDHYDEVSGEWWSTPPDGLWASTASWPDGTPIGVELVEDDFGLERARACHLQIRPDARICEVDRPEDWAELCRRYPLDVTAQRRQVWFETTGRRGRWVIPDWSRVAEEFDGVHVSLAGYLRTAGVVVVVGEGRLVEESPSLPTAGDTDDLTASLMAGWSPDMTYWLGDVITGVAEVADWVIDEDCDEWVRL